MPLWEVAVSGIFTTNVNAENQLLINLKCVCGAVNQPFLGGAILIRLFCLHSSFFLAVAGVG
jgi:hypothetical protein